MSNVRSILLRHIRLDGGTQARAKMDQAAIDEYAEAMEAGASFPAVVVFEDHTSNFLWLGDGFHRVAAADAAGKKNIKAEIRPGGLREARLFAIGANATHGIRRTNADKRLAVSLILDDPEWSAWGNREIARVAGVSEFLVRDMKEERVRLNRTPEPAPTAQSPILGEPDDEDPEVEPGDQDPPAAAPPNWLDHPNCPCVPLEPPAAPIKGAPLPPGPDDRDSRIVQLEHLVEAKDAELVEMGRKLEEAGAQVQELAEENASLHRIVDAEDLLAQFKEEVVRAQALARTTEERFRGMQNQNKALAKSAESWKRKFDNLQKKTKGAPVPEPDPELEDECPYPPAEV